MKPVKIVLIYQSLLGIYGDRGNATVLAKRLEWRGISAELEVVEPGERIPSDAQLYLLGGGEDMAQISAANAITADGGLYRGLESGAVLFAVCAGYQICGNSYTVGDNDTVVAGLGLLDVDTRRAPERAVGEILTRWERPDGSQSLITGFENHGGHTTLGRGARPLAAVEIGVGNANDGTEGAVQGRVIGSYPHGPILARNPQLADHLLTMATDRDMSPLDDSAIDRLRSERIARVRRGRK